MKESLYPKKGYRVLSMIHPRQYMKHPTNNGRYFGAWRYAEDRATQAQLAVFLIFVWMSLALTMSGVSTTTWVAWLAKPALNRKPPFRQSELFKFSSIY